MSLNQEEEEYIERLYREMYTRLCIYAMSALGSKALAEEVVQDTFRIACIKPDGLMSSKNPRGWLVNTLKNVIRLDLVMHYLRRCLRMSRRQAQLWRQQNSLLPTQML